MLKHYGVTPVMVFDGGLLPSKMGTEDERERCEPTWSSSVGLPCSLPDLLRVQASVRRARQGERVSCGREGGAGEGMLRQGGGRDTGDGLPAHQGASRRRMTKAHRIRDISRPILVRC